MTDKITLATLDNLENETSAVSAINSNSALIVAEMNNTLSRDGTSPNQMEAQLDMNGFQIINLPAPATVDSPARLADVIGDAVVTVPPTGTSGATVPFLNGNNTWSGTNDFTSTLTALTVATNDDSTNVATTEYVQNNLAAAGTTLSGLSVSGVPGTVSGTPTSITGTANQFLGVNSAGTVLGFETLAGDATLSGPTITLATVNADVGAFGSSTAIPTVTANAKGLVTALSTSAVVAPAGTLSGNTLASGVTASSLTSTSTTVKLGADTAAPAGTTLDAQSVSTGTNNQAGADWTVSGGKGTGTGVGGKIIVKTSPAGGSGTTQNSGTTKLTIDGPGNVVVGNAAIATNATDGFLYIPTCAGTPTGTPTTYTGMVPIVYDSTNNMFYIYDGSWLGGTNPGAFT